MFKYARRVVRNLLRIAPLRYLLSITLLFILLEHSSYLYSYRIPKAVSPLDAPFATQCLEPNSPSPRANATIFMLARNNDVDGAVRSIISLENQFNKWFHYPMVFLNDRQWDQHFIDSLTKVASGKVEFSVISDDSGMWGFPDWMDVSKARAHIADQAARNIVYGGVESYHHMCRFNAGKFFDHEALRPYKWYWRVEPDVQFTCAITYDPFLAMATSKKIYGYVMALWELGNTVPSLFRHVSNYKSAQSIQSSSLWKSFIDPSWAPLPIRPLLSKLPGRDSHGTAWNFCHYWSNFEIADMDWFRSSEYRDLFRVLDEAGGIYYERWGDAAIHSLAVALLLKPEETHHFSDIGYIHGPFQACPVSKPGGFGCRCECDYAVPIPQDVCQVALERAII